MKLCTQPQPHKFRTKPERGKKYSIQRIVDEASAYIDYCLAKDGDIEGFAATLRQLFYHLVGDGILLNNTPDYRNFGRYLNFAKGAGVLDWDSVYDRTRPLHGRERYLVEDAIKSCITFPHTWDLRQRLIKSRATRIRTLVRKPTPRAA
jgi:hypothetical protein